MARALFPAVLSTTRSVVFLWCLASFLPVLERGMVSLWVPAVSVLVVLLSTVPVIVTVPLAVVRTLMTSALPLTLALVIETVRAGDHPQRNDLWRDDHRHNRGRRRDGCGAWCSECRFFAAFGAVLVVARIQYLYVVPGVRPRFGSV